MGEPQRRSPDLPGWTLVNSQGEITQSGDEDSESSESSIEVLSLEDAETYLHLAERVASSQHENSQISAENISNVEDNRDPAIVYADVISALSETSQVVERLQPGVQSCSGQNPVDSSMVDSEQHDLSLSKSFSCEDRKVSNRGAVADMSPQVNDITTTQGESELKPSFLSEAHCDDVSRSESELEPTGLDFSGQSGSDSGLELAGPSEESEIPGSDHRSAETGSPGDIEPVGSPSEADSLGTSGIVEPAGSPSETDYLGAAENIEPVGLVISPEVDYLAPAGNTEPVGLVIPSEVNNFVTAGNTEPVGLVVPSEVDYFITAGNTEPVGLVIPSEVHCLVTAEVSSSQESDTSFRESTKEAIYGACCMELLMQSNKHQDTGASNAGVPEEVAHSPASVVSEDGTHSPASVVSDDGTSSSSDVTSLEDKSGSSLPADSLESRPSSGSSPTHSESSCSLKPDSDADSDFVRLDPEQVNAYVEEHRPSGDRVVIPLRLNRPGSSIGSGFHFIRNDALNDNEIQDEEPGDYDNQYGDDDTESSNEDGVDDRIESEQSEAGSMSMQYDVGDLSVFSDIGDLPLVAGNVPRNYIHQPNNHLSTVLNILVVLVAILTMGISLGIIMATDLEIEEWQTAHEFQARKVSQLELVLKSKTKAYEMQLGRVRELEPQVADLKNTLKGLERKVKTYERGLDAIMAHTSVEAGSLGGELQQVLSSINDYIQCQDQSATLAAYDCHVRFLSSVRHFATAINAQPLLQKSEVLNPLFGEKSPENGETGSSAQKRAGEDRLKTKWLSPEIDSSNQVFPEADSQLFSHGMTPEAAELGSSTEIIQPEQKGAGDSSDRGAQSQTPTQNDRSEVRSQSSTSEHGQAKSAGGFKESLQSPVTLDIRQLQQSLTREQERALHWQQLYLSERRQKERERENEELEDERERERTGREKEELDHLECLKKLMSSNLTTLTQHVARWNVTVFDDFANLSMLLSGIADLQTSVVESVQRAWKSADKVVSNIQEQTTKAGRQIWEKAISENSAMKEYLENMLAVIKNVNIPDHESIGDYVETIHNFIKQGVHVFSKEETPESQSKLVHTCILAEWEKAEDLLKSFMEKEGTLGHDKVSDLFNDIGILDYLSNIIIETCHKDYDEVKSHTREVNPQSKFETTANGPDMRSNFENGAPEDSETSDATHNNQKPDSSDERDPNHNGFWSRRIGKILKKTGKTVRKLGRKVVGTWDKIKSVWREEKKNIWHKIKNIWHDKKKNLKDEFVHSDRQLFTSVLKAPSGFYRRCSSSLSDSAEVDINHKCVLKMRKYWQKTVLNAPCETVGKFSYECNAGRRQLKKDMNKLSHGFSRLLKIPAFSVPQVLKLKEAYVQKYFQQFNSFIFQWRETELLLKSDVQWIQCQLSWWESVLSSLEDGRPDKLMSNLCGLVKLSDNWSHQLVKVNLVAGMQCDGTRKIGCLQDKDVPSGGRDNELDQEDQQLIDGTPDGENNDTVGLDDSDWYLTHDREWHPLPTQKENDEGGDDDEDNDDEFEEYSEVTSHFMTENENGGDDDDSDDEHEEDSEPNSYFIKENDDPRESKPKQMYSGNWMFQKAKDREEHRKEAEKSSWLFERATHRREAFNNKWEHKHDSKRPHPENKWEHIHDSNQPRPENKWEHRHDFKQPWPKNRAHHGDWFLKQAEERQKMRTDQQKSDWLFDRAADRKQKHDGQHSAHFNRLKQERNVHGKYYRHAYGKVTAP